MLTIHGRTARQLSKVEADWGMLGKIRQLRDDLSPSTLIVGNGDVLSRRQGDDLARRHQIDGIMIGRGVFHDPFVFAKKSPWPSMTVQQKLDLYKKHVKLFEKTWPDGDRRIQSLNKFCKIYVNDFDGAKELREKLMKSISAQEILTNLASV
jgi:tRNA-dihydrouridine synthase